MTWDGTSKNTSIMTPEKNSLFESIRMIIERSREHVFTIANSVLLESYWQIGKLIVEDEQSGAHRAQYGKATLKNLAVQLSLEFGKGFDESNLRNMRAFFLAFPIRDALRHNLSWTHYRILSRIESPEKRNYYLSQCTTSNWNTRNLQRNIAKAICCKNKQPQGILRPEVKANRFNLSSEVDKRRVKCLSPLPASGLALPLPHARKKPSLDPESRPRGRTSIRDRCHRAASGASAHRCIRFLL